jgi:hypothetical protein
MTHRARRLADAFGEAYRQAHPKTDPEAAPTAAEVEQAGVNALRALICGGPPPEEESTE